MFRKQYLKKNSNKSCDLEGEKRWKYLTLSVGAKASHIPYKKLKG